MPRLFFKDIPEEPACSSCGNPDVNKFHVDVELYFCDEECFVEWYIENMSVNHAIKYYDEFTYDVSD